MNRLLRTCACIVVVTGFLEAWVTGQGAAVSQAGLYLRLAPIGFIDYGMPARSEVVFIEGEPLVFEVGIRNARPDTIAMADENWPAMVDLAIYEGRRRAADSTGIPLTCAPASMQQEGTVRHENGRVSVNEPSDHQFFRCSFNSQELGLQPGLYNLQAVWKGTAPTPGPFRLHDSIAFEFRSAIADDDRADGLLHRAQRALSEGRLSEAESAVAEVLRTRPSSARALAIRGAAFARRGDCVRAVNDLNRAANILENAGDAAERNVQFRDPAQRRRATQAWRDQARRLGC